MIDYLEWMKLIPYSGGILLFILIAEFLKRKMKISTSFTRKFVHFGVGILTFLTPFLFHDVKPLIFVAISFVIVNALTLYFKTFSGMDAQRRTYGTVMFPLSFLILLLFAWETHRFLIAYGIALMTFADGAASIVGEGLKNTKIYRPVTDKKSVQGSAALFIVASLITFLFIQFKWLGIDTTRIYGIFTATGIILTMGIITVLLENLSLYGSDNVSLPIIGSLFFLRLLENSTSIFPIFTVVLITITFIAIVSYHYKWLTSGGGMMMLLIGLSIVSFGSWKMLVPLFLFFILSSLLSKFRDGKAQNIKDNIADKGSTRDAFQVLANGSLPALIAVLSYFYNYELLLLVFGAVIAVVTSDTWSTEIGYFSKKKPVSIINFKNVPKGTSGGITLLGSLGGIAGAFVIALSMLIVFPELISFKEVFIITIAGFAGSLFDSLLGATFQVKYKCNNCGKIIEKRIHCNAASEYNNGIRFINNDWVNFFCAAFALIVVYMFY